MDNIKQDQKMSQSEEILFKNSILVLGELDIEDWNETLKEDSEEGRYMRMILSSMEELASIKVRASERLRVEDGMSSINEANKLRDEISKLKQEKEELTRLLFLASNIIDDCNRYQGANLVNGEIEEFFKIESALTKQQ